MSDIFDDDEDLDEIEPFVDPEEELINAESGESSTLSARRRLEKMLEEKELMAQLRDELDDFADD
ncbi:PA3496 family putative envelope integrity protein [Legionella jordanis]|uniref:Uncharacterized protein n=1 Tax=Legionella jordanis TaxID=456 RepID=A0A0W0VE01_9GAMM|nr:hypothetical protein [Legionella jordanis]KTD18356.1 hypothetical protein Ljor_2662 [Legionella jordanis]RMX05267.1 hypothetical protein EAW55_00980 [Legionella jordanis]RMX20882.1 hypothetical protein EAS68_06065 [Legionella jordanis]VEH13298.1 Uncharacterised protein [Legionella jordanis]HAT8713646.1 hypothetical protein [Legionella jordanis]